MPDYSVSTSFTAHDAVSSTWEKISHGADKFSEAVEKAFKHGEEKAEHAKGIFGAVFSGELLAKGVEKIAEKVKELPEAVEAFAEKGEAIGRMATRLGMSAESFQRISYAAKMFDVPADVMEKSIGKMNVGLAQLKTHSGAIEEGLKHLNPALMMQLRTAQDSQSALFMVADAIQSTSSAQKRAAIATAVFGKAGQDMLPMLTKGREGIEELMAETDKYGAVLSDSAVEASGRFSDSLKKTRASVEAVQNTVMGAVLEGINPLLESFSEWIAANKEVVATNITNFVMGLGQAIQTATPYVQALLGFIRDWGPAILAGVAAFEAVKIAMMAAAGAAALFETVNAVIFAFQAVTGGAATVMEGLNLVMAANPVGLITLAIAGLIGLIVLMATHWDETVKLFMIGADFIKKSVLSILAVAFAPWIIAIDTLMSGLVALGKLAGMDVSGLESFQAGARKFVMENTFAGDIKDAVTGSKKDDAPNASNLQARNGVPSFVNNINVDNSAAPGVTSKVRSAPALNANLAAANP